MPSPTSWSSTTYVSLTYSQNIDALLWGTRWASSTITYSFPGYSSVWSTSTTTGYGPRSGSREPWSVYYDILSTSDQIYFAAALQKWANIANLQFSLVADTSTSVGDIRAAYTPLSSGTQAHAYLPSDSSVAGDVWINSGGSSAALYWTLGSYENFAVLHELGHALGLKHPFEVGGLSSTVLPSSLDTQSYTVMSYSAQPGDSTTYFSYYPTTPMIFDIRAIQYVYGANNSYHAGNDTYSYSDATTYHEAIWDAGGTDTIQYTGYLSSSIDLRSGYGSDIGWNIYQKSAYGVNLQSVNNVWIAFNVTIENAIGGSGNDTLTGNDANNSLEGGSGSDTLTGGAGNDTFDWSASSRSGNDVFYGGTGDDIYVLDSVGDRVVENSGEGTDTIHVNFSFSLSSTPYVEELGAFGSNGVSLTGNSVNNEIRGELGNDTLDGGAGIDTLIGGLGNDTYIVDNASDITTETSTLTTEIDTVQSSVSRTLGANLENLTLTGTATINGTGNTLNNTLTGNAANNSLDGGSGNDTIYGGAGNDKFDWGISLRAGADVFYGGTGDDAYALDAANDSVVEYAGEGIDTIYSDSYSLSNLPNVENLIAFSDSTGVTFTGNSASNWFRGASGNDTIDGGAGNDYMDYSGNRASYIITAATNGYLITSASDGADTLTNVEYAVFSDQTITLSTIDTTAPTVTTFNPADAATGVALASNIVVTFSEAIQRGTGNIVLKNAAGTVIETFNAATSSNLSISGTTMTINPTNNLAYSTNHFVTFASGTVKDLAGNAYTGTTTYDFTTVAAPDTTAPTVSTFNPADAATGVAITSNIVVTFSEAIQRGTGSIVLKNAAGTVIETFDAAASSNLSISGTTLTINPTSNLAYSTNHFVTFASGTIKDLAGNAYTGTTTYDFTTVAAPITVTGSADNDAMIGGAGNDSLDGGAGIDIANYTGNRAGFTVTQSSTSFIVTDNTGANGTDTLTNIERLAFADSRIALDINGVAGQAYRIYQAAFNRTPDIAGLTFWVSSMDAGMPLTQVANYFIQSAEFQTMYGANPTNANFVTSLYANTLHRAPDQGGFAYWTNQLAGQAMTRPEVLAGFSESAENYVNVIGTIQNGIILDLI